MSKESSDGFSIRGIDHHFVGIISHDRTIWFDNPIKNKAIGVPESELFDLFLRLEGPLAIAERLYASPGRVKCLKVKDYRITGFENDEFIVVLRNLANEYGLDTIFRKTRRSIEENGGRYYSDIHDPGYSPVTANETLV